MKVIGHETVCENCETVRTRGAQKLPSHGLDDHVRFEQPRPLTRATRDEIAPSADIGAARQACGHAASGATAVPVPGFARRSSEAPCSARLCRALATASASACVETALQSPAATRGVDQHSGGSVPARPRARTYPMPSHPSRAASARSRLGSGAARSTSPDRGGCGRPGSVRGTGGGRAGTPGARSCR